MLGPDWRHVNEWKDQKGYPNPQWGPYRRSGISRAKPANRL